MRLFSKNDTSKLRRSTNGGADINHVPMLSQVGLTRSYIFSMTDQPLAIPSFRYHQPTLIEQGLNGNIKTGILIMFLTRLPMLWWPLHMIENG